MNEKKNLELYNFLLKELSLIQLYKLEEDVSKKENLIIKLEEELMNELNYFENVNFSRINFFYKDYYPSPAIRIVLLFKDDEENYLLFKNDKNEFEIINSLIDINHKIYAKINEILKEKDIHLLKKPKLIIIFESKIDKIKNERFKELKKEEILNLDKSTFKGEINTLDLIEIIQSIDDKNKIIID